MAERLSRDVYVDGRWLKSYTVDGELFRTLSGRRWKAMQTRCTNTNYKQRHPTYADATCTFKDFDSFVEWSRNQVGYWEANWHLDKDFLSGKEYSEESCVFLPQEINKFSNVRENARGEYPLGVSLRNGKYVVRHWDGNGQRRHVGSYFCPDEAARIYKECKIRTAKELAARWNGLVDQRVTDVLMNYEVKE